jgi:lipopolysaccharide export system protein LptA
MSYFTEVSLKVFTRAITALFAIAISLSCRSAPPIDDREGGRTAEESIPDGTEPSDREAAAVPAGSGKNRLAEESKTRSGRLLRTIITGEELIREKVIVDNKEVIRLTFRGSAVIDHEGIQIFAPEIVMDGGSKAHTKGGITIYDGKSGVRIQADRGDYDKFQETVLITGNPKMVVQKTKREPPLRITTNRMVRHLSERRSVFEGDVRIFHQEWAVVGDHGTMLDEKSEITLEKNPMIFGPNQFLTGDHLIYNTRTRELVLNDNVLYLSSGDEISPRASEPVSLETFARRAGRIDEQAGDSIKRTEISARTLAYHLGVGDAPTAELRGDVLITGTDLYARTPYLRTKGRDFGTIYTDQGIDMIDKVENIHVTAGEMFYERKARKMRLDLHPRMEFLGKQEGLQSGILEAAVIETNFATRETLARGDVRIQRENFSAAGEIASYRRDERVIVLEGDPSLRQGASTMQSEKIYIYPDTEKVLLFNRIRGYISEE